MGILQSTPCKKRADIEPALKKKEELLKKVAQMNSVKEELESALKTTEEAIAVHEGYLKSNEDYINVMMCIQPVEELGTFAFVVEFFKTPFLDDKKRKRSDVEKDARALKRQRCADVSDSRKRVAGFKKELAALKETALNLAKGIISSEGVLKDIHDELKGLRKYIKDLRVFEETVVPEEQVVPAPVFRRRSI